MDPLARAIQIAAEAHQGQVDKAGEPYILHCLRVMLKVESREERIVVVMHDLLEDTSWSRGDLEREGFSREVVNAIVALTRMAGESYEAFVRRAASNPIARSVKLADLEDNMDLSRIPEATERDRERLEKYERAYEVVRGRATDDATA